jgi:hypothetical protein
VRWKLALNAFAITFADRFPAAENYFPRFSSRRRSSRTRDHHHPLAMAIPSALSKSDPLSVNDRNGATLPFAKRP